MKRFLTLLLLGPAVLGRAALAFEEDFYPFLQPWNASNWVASDDSVRPGGLSKSYLEVLEPETEQNPSDESVFRFWGTLNRESLGGGFASQRTADDWPGIDLSEYRGVIVESPYSDGKTYSINFKDTVPPTVDGVEQAGVSWEYDFTFPATATGPPSVDSVSYVEELIDFKNLVPTLRGRKLNDTAPLNLKNIKRINIMIRT